MVRDLTDKLLQNNLLFQLKRYEFEVYSIYCNVPRVVNFDV